MSALKTDVKVWRTEERGMGAHSHHKLTLFHIKMASKSSWHIRKVACFKHCSGQLKEFLYSTALLELSFCRHFFAFPRRIVAILEDENAKSH